MTRRPSSASRLPDSSSWRPFSRSRSCSIPTSPSAPASGWNDQAVVHSAGKLLRSRPKLTATLYLATGGDDDRGDAVKALAAVLRADAPKGLTWYYEPRADLQHSTIYKGASPGGFRKLFPPR